MPYFVRQISENASVLKHERFSAALRPVIEKVVIPRFARNHLCSFVITARRVALTRSHAAAKIRIPVPLARDSMLIFVWPHNVRKRVRAETRAAFGRFAARNR